MGEAGVAAFDALKTKADGKPIYVFGASIGSAVALHVAANRDVRGLVLHNPPPLRQIILRNYGWWNLWLLAGPVALQIPPDLDSVANAKRIHAPAIFLLAENDEIVPPRFQRLVVDSFAGEKQVIPLPGAYHNSPIEGPVVTEIHHVLRLVIWCRALTIAHASKATPAWTCGANGHLAPCVSLLRRGSRIPLQLPQAA
jgi:pimeloyl-ACP methyl ester carboxylesterase